MSLHVLLPNGAGPASQWTPFGAATNWEAVLAGDAAFVSTPDDGVFDLYTFESLPPEVTNVESVAVHYVAIGDGSAQLHSIIQVDSQDGSGFPLSVPPVEPGAEHVDTYLLHPDGDPWGARVASVNAILAGIEAVTAADPTVVGRVWIVVDDGEEEEEAEYAHGTPAVLAGDEFPAIVNRDERSTAVAMLDGRDVPTINRDERETASVMVPGRGTPAVMMEDE